MGAGDISSEYASSSRVVLVPPVTTLLTPDERLRLDAAGVGVYRALHRASVAELMRDLRERSAAAMVVSAAASLQLDPARLASVVREFPRVPSVALVSQLDSQAAQAVLTLGRCGIRTLIDVRDPRGWQELRNVLISDRAADIHRTALAQLSLDLGDAPIGSLEFFRILFRDAESPRTVREIAARLQVVPSTLMSRFYRASLPAPKHYLSGARLIRAARLLENSGLSVSAVADFLDYYPLDFR
jgi:AraC-like DNA-binding protein